MDAALARPKLPRRALVGATLARSESDCSSDLYQCLKVYSSHIHVTWRTRGKQYMLGFTMSCPFGQVGRRFSCHLSDV